MWRCEDVKMWGCEDEKIWRWEDVKMRRCEDEKMWRWEDVKMADVGVGRCEDVGMWGWEGVGMWGCEDVMWGCEDEKMWRWEDVKMSWCEDEQMWRWEDVKMRRCEDVRMWRCEDVRMRRCEDEKMWRWADVKMSRCEDEKMRRCEDEMMWICDDEKMWRWEDVLQTPTIGRALRSDALGKMERCGCWGYHRRLLKNGGDTGCPVERGCETSFWMGRRDICVLYQWMVYCMVLCSWCILAMPMSLVARFAIWRCIRFCLAWYSVFWLFWWAELEEVPFWDAFIFILHGILRFGYAGELSWEMCYSEMRSSLPCVVLCVLATPMNLAGRCAVRRCVHLCFALCFLHFGYVDELSWEIYSIWKCWSSMYIPSWEVFWVIGQIGSRPRDHLRSFEGFRTVLQGFGVGRCRVCAWVHHWVINLWPTKLLGFLPNDVCCHHLSEAEWWLMGGKPTYMGFNDLSI